MTDDNEVDALIHGLARQVHRSYRMVPFQDLYECGLIWVQAHPLRVREYLDHEDEKRGWGKLTVAIIRAMSRMARQEKAFSAGYRPEDEAYYNLALVETVLPAVFNPDEAGDAPQGEQHEIRGSHDPSVQNPWPVHLADVSRAWKRADLSVAQRGMVRLRYGEHKPLAIVAAVYERGIADVEHELRDALRRLIDQLGGDKPQPCPHACKECPRV